MRNSDLARQLVHDSYRHDEGLPSRSAVWVAGLVLAAIITWYWGLSALWRLVVFLRP